MITGLVCENYRSLKRIEIPLGPLTAMVGPNGSGKTTILKSIGIVLGQAWPTLRSFHIPGDFTAYDSDKDLVLRVEFGPPLTFEDTLGKTHEIAALQVRCAAYKRRTKRAEAGDMHVDFSPLDAGGDVPMVAVGWESTRRPMFRPLTVSSGLREQALALFIDHRRSVVQHLPAVRGSALGRLLEPARREFGRANGGAAPRVEFERRYEAAMETLRTPRVKHIEQTISETTKRSLGFLGSRAMRSIDVSFGIADPANPFNDLRIMYREGGLLLPAEELGLGVQSAIVVGVFEALRQLGGPIGSVVIEEPEMYLHPQAQRYFYRLLAELAERGDAQVIYSTHSPIFADATRFESIRLVRREPGESTSVSFVSSPEDQEYLNGRRKGLKLLTSFDPTRGEMLFARRVLLVEGPGDQVAARYVATEIGLDLDAEDLAVVACGAKSAIPFFARTCAALGIPFLVMHDEDVRPETGDEERVKKIRDENRKAEAENREILAAALDVERVFVLRPSLEEELGISRNASDKPRRIIGELRGRDVSAMPGDLVSAVQALGTDPSSAGDAPAPSNGSEASQDRKK